MKHLGSVRLDKACEDHKVGMLHTISYCFHHYNHDMSVPIDKYLNKIPRRQIMDSLNLVCFEGEA